MHLGITELGVLPWHVKFNLSDLFNGPFPNTPGCTNLHCLPSTGHTAQPSEFHWYLLNQYIPDYGLNHYIIALVVAHTEQIINVKANCSIHTFTFEGLPEIGPPKDSMA